MSKKRHSTQNSDFENWKKSDREEVLSKRFQYQIALQNKDLMGFVKRIRSMDFSPHYKLEM